MSLTKAADLKGKKVGGAGANLRLFDGTGATGVPSTLDNWYNGLQLGIYDAVMAWAQVAGSFKLCEPAPFMLDAGFGSAGVHTLTVNNDVWAKLPDEVKSALTKHGDTWHKAQIALLLKGSSAAMDFCKQKHGLVVAKLSDEERKTWAKGLPPLGLQWAKGLESAGLPGNAYIKAYMDRMREAKQLVYRNWDAE
jgi:TRAP-type C4-dicarboxylate transport system substrate-binding protein